MSAPAVPSENLAAALERYWGYSSFRPLQREAMDAVVRGRALRRHLDDDEIGFGRKAPIAAIGQGASASCGGASRRGTVSDRVARG